MNKLRSNKLREGGGVAIGIDRRLVFRDISNRIPDLKPLEIICV